MLTNFFFMQWILAGTPRAGSLLAPIISVSVDNIKMNIKDIVNGGKGAPKRVVPANIH